VGIHGAGVACCGPPCTAGNPWFGCPRPLVRAAGGPSWAVCHRWFLRGFANRFSLVSVFALFSALFSRIDFPVFLALLFLGDFSDNGITPF